MTHDTFFGHRITRAWRLAFAAGVVALFLGTHWPNLKMGEAVPATDKTIHMVVFAVLTWLFWRAKWTTSRWLTVCAVASFGLVNEWSQGLPFINRHVSAADGLANTLGVVIAGSWLWALAPVGGRVNRRRLATSQHAWERIFFPVRAWVRYTLLALPFALTVFWAYFFLPADIARRVILSAMIAGTITLHAVLFHNWRQSLLVVRTQRRCHACDAKVHVHEGSRRLIDATFAGGTCAACGHRHEMATWADSGTPTPRALWRAGGVSLLVLIFGASLLIGLITLFPVLHAAVISGDPAGERWVSGGRLMRMALLNDGMSQAIDLAVLCLLLSVAVRLYRSRVAAVLIDRPDRCVSCGYNLSGTPVVDGVGRCGECGQGFFVLEDAERTAAGRGG